MTVEIKWEAPVDGCRKGRLFLNNEEIGWIEERYENND